MRREGSTPEFSKARQHDPNPLPCPGSTVVIHRSRHFFEFPPVPVKARGFLSQALWFFTPGRAPIPFPPPVYTLNEAGAARDFQGIFGGGSAFESSGLCQIYICFHCSFSDALGLGHPTGRISPPIPKTPPGALERRGDSRNSKISDPM